MTNDMYFSDAYRSLHKITENGEEILEYLRKGKLVTSLPIDGQFKFWVCIPEQYWIDTGMEGIRPLRFPKEFKNQRFKIKVAAILPFLVPALEQIESAQSGGGWETVGNLGNAWFFGEMEQTLFDPLVPHQCSEILTQIRRALFLQSNVSIRPKCSSIIVTELKQDAKILHGNKPGRKNKEVEDDDFWVMVINSVSDGKFKNQSVVVKDILKLVNDSDLRNDLYEKTFIINQLKKFWKKSKRYVAKSGK